MHCHTCVDFIHMPWLFDFYKVQHFSPRDRTPVLGAGKILERKVAGSNPARDIFSLSILTTRRSPYKINETKHAVN